VAQGGPETRLRTAEQWFRTTPFRYTLQPGALPERAPLDAFLFERRQGFCGHFASGFTALMRAAGVPARVVSGYRGGEWVQPLGGAAATSNFARPMPMPGVRCGWRERAGAGLIPPPGSPPAPALATRVRGAAARTSAPWHWLQRQWWGLDLAWSTFWLGFDRSSQAALLERLLGPWKAWAGLLGLLAFAACLAAGLLAAALAPTPCSSATHGGGNSTGC
jgi:transglutaminase-like putative cysteine protease